MVIWGYYVYGYGQIFTDNGTKIGLPFYVFSYSFPSMTALVNGNFVVTSIWSTGSTDVLYTQIFYSNGTKIGAASVVNTYSVWSENPSISSVSTSNFMVVWQQIRDRATGTSWDVYGQSFTNSGANIGNIFRINSYITSLQLNPSIVSLANDNYIVIWQSNLQDGSGYGIYGQILDSIGNTIGKEFKVNSYTISTQSLPSVATLINNNFVVVWNSNNQDGSAWGVFGNIYRSDGSGIGFNTCPYNCQSCANSTNCKICNPNFKLESNGLCGCFDGFYLDNISASFCTSKFISSN